MTITVESLEEFFSQVAIAELQLRIANKRRYLMPVTVEVEYQRRKAAISTWEDILALAKDILYLVGELKEIEG